MANRVETQCPHTGYHLNDCTQQPCLHLLNSGLHYPVKGKSDPITVLLKTLTSLSSGQLPLGSPFLLSSLSLTISRKKAVGGKKAFPQMSQTPQRFYSHCLFPQVAKICLQYPSDWLSHVLQVFGQMSFF